MIYATILNPLHEHVEHAKEYLTTCGCPYTVVDTYSTVLTEGPLAWCITDDTCKLRINNLDQLKDVYNEYVDAK